MHLESCRHLLRELVFVGLGLGLTLTPAPRPAQPLIEGHGQGTVIRNLGFPHGTPLLDGFRFRFGPPWVAPSALDHHLGTIELLLGRPSPRQITLALRDKNGDDTFAYVGSFHTRPSSGIELGEFETELCSAYGCYKAIRLPDDDRVFVLRGFGFSTISAKEAHLERIRVRERDGLLEIWPWFVTPQLIGNPDSIAFTARVEWALLPPDRVRQVGVSSGTARGSDHREIPPGDSVIRGFDLSFTRGHHIREIGVLTPESGRVEVFFNDKDQDDDFDWSVDWAILEPAS